MKSISKILAAFCLAASFSMVQPPQPARADIFIRIAPPVLPVYVLPPIPGPDYIWSPGYWAYDDEVDDYYWVPGTWVLAPRPGFLWTPGYWAFYDGGYRWHAGYWGPHVGFYGGINYGFGYGGYGYEGGRWDNGHFFYNTNVYHVNKTIIKNTYVKNVTVVKNVTKVSFNGGDGGTKVKPNAEQTKWDKEDHVAPTKIQTEHQSSAKGNKAFFAKANHGKPSIAATSTAGTFAGKGIVGAKGSKPFVPDKTTTKSSTGEAATGGAPTTGKNGAGKNGEKTGSKVSRDVVTPGAGASAGAGTEHHDKKTVKTLKTPTLNGNGPGSSQTPKTKTFEQKNANVPKIKSQRVTGTQNKTVTHRTEQHNGPKPNNGQGGQDGGKKKREGN